MKAVQASPNQISYNTYVCGSCNKTAEKLQKCTGCYFILYCDTECQKKHWPEHKLVCQKKKYIEVVQNSVAIILNKKTPKTLQYLFTDNLRSCVAVMAKGEHGIALLHDVGYLTEKSIKAAFQQIGNLEFWATAAYPHVDEEYSKIEPDRYQELFGKVGGFYLSQIERIRRIMTAIDVSARSKQKKPEDSDYYIASERCAWIDRSGKIYTQTKPEKCVLLEKIPHLVLRKNINELNSTVAKKEFDCHLQFDGVNFTPIPLPIRSEEEIKSMAQTDQMIAAGFERYLKIMDLLLSTL